MNTCCGGGIIYCYYCLMLFEDDLILPEPNPTEWAVGSVGYSWTIQGL